MSADRVTVEAADLSGLPGSVTSGVLGGLELAFNPMGAEARDELDVE